MAKQVANFQVGSIVEWNWMGRKVRGTIKKIYLKPVSKILRGFEFKRNGSLEKPAYLIVSDAGSEVLKGFSELTALRSSSKKPKA